MAAVKLENNYEERIENLLRETYYSGIRRVLRGKRGDKAALISPEDLEFLEKVENLLNESSYSGERVILQGKEGNKVAMVSLEDLDLLEEFDRGSLLK